MPDVTKVNHEYSSASGGLIDATRVQSVTVTSHVITTPVMAFGVQGVAGILNGYGTAEVTVETAVGTGFNIPGKSDFEAEGTTISVTTGGVSWAISGAVLSSYTLTIPANDICTESFTYVGTVGAATSGEASPTVGTGSLDMLSGAAIEAIPGIAGTSATVTYTADRDEIHYIGEALADPPGPQRPIRYPITCDITVEYLASAVSYLSDFISNYEWTPPGMDISIGGATFGNMRPVDGSLSAGVGDNSTVSVSFTGWLAA